MEDLRDLPRPLGRRWCLHSLPCTGLQGTCFPGLAGRAGPGPPSAAGSDFLTFWFSHLPCPRRHGLLSRPAPTPGTGTSELGRGLRRGVGQPVGAAPGGGGSEESPLAQGQDEVWFNLLPSLPQRLARSRSKAGMTHLPGSSSAFLPLFPSLGMFFPAGYASWSPALPPGLSLGHLFDPLTWDSGSHLKAALLLLL